MVSRIWKRRPWTSSCWQRIVRSNPNQSTWLGTSTLNWSTVSPTKSSTSTKTSFQGKWWKFPTCGLTIIDTTLRWTFTVRSANRSSFRFWHSRIQKCRNYLTRSSAQCSKLMIKNIRDCYTWKTRSSLIKGKHYWTWELSWLLSRYRAKCRICKYWIATNLRSKTWTSNLTKSTFSGTT